MNTAVSCRKCGAPVTADARDGVCPKCLFNLAAAGIDPLVSEIQNQKSEIKNLETVLHAFGDYELLEEIARGGMGVVYKARQKSLGRLVAVKLILAGQFAGKQIAQRFKSEAIAAAVLQHPNIVAVHEVGVHEGQHFFSMDYVEGQNLAERVAQRPRSPREAARYVKLIAEAIHYAHEQGILHRDLKPSNVLIDAATDQPRVTDFGLAKRLDGESSLTVTGQVLGSPHFMPPEQAGRGRGKVGRTSDVFGLGGILYFLLTARAPFQGETMEATIEQVLHAEPVSPRLLNLAVPRDLETICLKCLEKEPSRRYATAGEVVEELGRFLRDEPILARPVSAMERAWRWCRRKPVIAALVCAVLLVGSFGLAGIVWQWERAGAQARKAFQSEKQSRRFLYASDMNLAQQALKLNNLGQARRLLERHRPQPGEEDLRGWEWRYLWQLTRGSALATLTNRPMMQGCLVGFSPDGKSLAVGWRDGRVDLWDVPGRRWVRALTDRERPHPGRVAFSPARNLLAATSEHMMVTLYDLDSGRESILWRAPDQAEWDVRDLAFSQDGSRLVIYAGSNPEGDDAVWVVNVSSSQIESIHPAGCSHHAYEHIGAARLSPDNQRLYLTRSDYLNHRYSIQCIDLSTRKELWQTESQHDTPGPTALDISPDGRVLASSSGFSDSLIRVWNAATGEPLKQLDGHGHITCVYHLAFTRDGRHLISAGGDQTIRFWDTNAWTETQVLRGHSDEVWAIAISEPAQLIASVSKDGDLKLWTKDGTRAADGYRRLSESLGDNDVHPLDHSRVLLLPPGQPPELVDLKRDSAPVPLPEVGASANVLGCFDTNLLCVWNVINDSLGTNLLSNGLTDWVAEQHNNAHASFTRTYDFTNNQPSLKVSVTNADTTGWYIQLNYPNLKLASNLAYTISFAAKATPATNAEVSVMQAHPDWLGLGYYHSLSLATNWQWFTHIFQPSAGDTNARVSFGGMGDKLSTFWFADVRLQTGTNHTNQILVGELRGAEFVQRGAISLDSGLRPTGLAYNPARQLLAWTERTSSKSIYLASLAAPGRRIELRSDVQGLVPFRFSDDGNYLAATRGRETLRTWNVESGQIVASINQNFSDACFAANGSVLVVALHHRIRSEIGFYDLARPDRVPQRVPGGFFSTKLAVSPDGGLVSATPLDGRILLLDPAMGKLIESLHGHLIVAGSSVFSPDGRRLLSTYGGQEAVKLWDVGTRQELLTLAGTRDIDAARWSADGNVILAGPPWQTWSAPSWEEIAAAEAKDPPAPGYGGQGKTENKQP